MEVGGSEVRPLAPRPYGEGPRSDADEIAKHLDALRRRWGIVLVAFAVCLPVAWVIESRSVDVFTASAIVRRDLTGSPLDPFGRIGPRVAEMEGDIEVIRSSAVMGPVVDSLGLRLRIPERRVSSSPLLHNVTVGPAAPVGRFVLARRGADNVLLAENGETELARAPLGELLSLPGLAFRVVPAQLGADGDVEIEVLPRENAFVRLSRQVRIEPVDNTLILNIRYTAPDPELAAAVVNQVATSFQEYRLLRAREAAIRRREFIADQLSQAYDSLQAAQELLLLYQESTSTLDPEIEAQSLAQGLVAAEETFRSLRFQENVLTDLIASLGGDGAASSYQRVMTVGRDLIPGASDLHSRLQDLETERSRLTASRFGFTEAGPEVEVLDSLIDNAHRDVRVAADQSLAFIRTQREQQEARVDELRLELGAVPSRTSGFARLRQRVAQIQETVNMLASRYSDAKIAEAVEVGDVEIVDRAVVPITPDPRGKNRAFVIAIFASLLLGFAGVRVAEYLDAAIRTVDDARGATSVELLAVIPRIEGAPSGNGDGRIASLDSRGIEAFRVLRTHLRFARPQEVQVVTVTSAEPGEGKSFTAANLARALATEGRSVLLVDADLRRPVLHQRFGITRAPGLIDVLVGAVTAEDAIKTAEKDGIRILPAGTQSVRPAELIGHPSFKELLTNLREHYDTIVVDTPPVLAVTDAALISRATDSVMLVGRASRTNKAAFRLATEELVRLDCDVVGFVLNDVARRRLGVSYYGHYRYGDYHGYNADENGAGSRA